MEFVAKLLYDVAPILIGEGLSLITLLAAERIGR